MSRNAANTAAPANSSGVRTATANESTNSRSSSTTWAGEALDGGRNATPPAWIAWTALAFTSAGSATEPCTRSTATAIVRDDSSVPMTAMPMAKPTWRAVLFAPPAAPDFSGATSDSTTLVSWATDSPKPIP